MEKMLRIMSSQIQTRISRSMTSNVPFTQLAAMPGLKTFGGTIYEPPSARVWRSLWGINDNVADGAQGFENNHALHSRRSAST